MGDVIVFGGLGLVLASWAALAVLSLFRPDRKPPPGAFESYIARIENMGEQRWGRLQLADKTVTFTPSGETTGASLPIEAITATEFSWGSPTFLVHFGLGTWRFTTRRRGLPLSKDVAGVDGWRACKEWRRQFQGLGIRIEPEATWTDGRGSGQGSS